MRFNLKQNNKKVYDQGNHIITSKHEALFVMSFIMNTSLLSQKNEHVSEEETCLRRTFKSVRCLKDVFSKRKSWLLSLAHQKHYKPRLGPVQSRECSCGASVEMGNHTPQPGHWQEAPSGVSLPGQPSDKISQ